MTPPAQATGRRSWGVVVLAVPLVAVLVLAGVGAAASLRAGARAERVRGLVPFAGALTTLVDELQRERSLSAAQPVPGPALERARDAVDRAAAAYRDAAVRVEISDRDRELHRRLTDGLAQLAGLAVLRATVDDAGGNDAATSVTVFRSYTRVIGGLLGVGTEIGLREAGQDAGLLRAVTAASAFSRAKELADRERSAAASAADGTEGVDAAERVRLAALGGRQDALLDQFAAMATPEQLAWYSRAFPDTEVERSAALRRAALEGGSGPGSGADLAGWSGSATARFERMRGGRARPHRRGGPPGHPHRPGRRPPDPGLRRRLLPRRQHPGRPPGPGPRPFPPIRRPVVRPGLQPGPRLGPGMGPGRAEPAAAAAGSPGGGA